jgi:hypothetical protein
VDERTGGRNSRLRDEPDLKCAECGALWRSHAAQELAREQGCLICGGGPLVEARAPADDDDPREGNDQ